MNTGQQLFSNVYNNMFIKLDNNLYNTFATPTSHDLHRTGNTYFTRSTPFWQHSPHMIYTELTTPTSHDLH